jgi:hypothetical protein
MADRPLFLFHYQSIVKAVVSRHILATHREFTHENIGKNG